MANVFLLRHAMPSLDPVLTPAQWGLSVEGRPAARALSGRLPMGLPRVASAERKAQETLTLALPGPFVIDERFNEIQRPAESFGEDVRVVRRSWVAGALDERHEGWETPTDAAVRFDAALRADSSEGMIVASHGMVLTAWMVSADAVPPGEEAARFWDQLRFPDIVTVDLLWPFSFGTRGCASAVWF